MKLREALVTYLRIVTQLDIWSNEVHGHDWLLEAYDLVALEINAQSLPDNQKSLARLHDEEIEAYLIDLAGDLATQRLSRPLAPPPLPPEGSTLRAPFWCSKDNFLLDVQNLGVSDAKDAAHLEASLCTSQSTLSVAPLSAI